MAANSLGHCLQLHTFGESHGPALGAIVEGVPAGTPWRPEILKQELERRRPGTAPWVSARQEEDQPEVLSGVYENKFLGTPVAVIVRNTDARPADYAQIAQTPRAGHADDVWKDKFGFSDPRGGGRSSGRETLSRVIGGAMARMILGELCPDLKVRGFITALGPHSLNEQEVQEFLKSDNSVDHFEARFPSRRTKIGEELVRVKSEGNSWGGICEVRVQGVPKGLGQPVLDRKSVV